MASNTLDQCAVHYPIAIPGGTAHYTIQENFGACNTDSYADGISSTLSHELFETILASQWQYFGEEIADICQSVSHWIELPQYQLILGNDRWYDIQPEWSNKDAHCYPITDETYKLVILP